MIKEFSSLHGHSHYSLFDGLSTPEENVKAAKEKGLRSIAITDHGSLHGHADFFLAGKKHGVRTIFGSEAYVIHDLKEWNELRAQANAAKKAKGKRDISSEGADVELAKIDSKILRRKGHLVLLATGRQGLSNLNQLTYRAHRDGFYGKPRMDKAMLGEFSTGLVASSACMGGVISKVCWEWSNKKVEWKDVIREAEEFDDIFGRGRFYLEIQLNEHAGQKFINDCMVRIHDETGIPLTVTTDFHYSRQEEWEAREILHMLDWNKTIKDFPDRKIDTEIKQLFVKSPEDMWRSYEQFGETVPEDHMRQAFENTLVIDSLVEEYEPDTHQRLPTLPYENPFKEMGSRAIDGLRRLGLADDERYKARMLHELGVIKEKGIANYFIIVQNIIAEAKKTMLVGAGRGSAAGSLVCYALGITDLDPITHGLLFERFLDPHRVELPDIDVDFMDADAAKDMLRRMFGDDNVACLSTYGTFQIKGLLKDLARVYDLDHNEMNRMNKQIEKELRVLYINQDKSTIVIKLEDIERVSPTFNKFVDRYPEVGQHLKHLYNRNRHIGRHACGVIIGDDLPAETAIFKADFKNGGVVQASFTEGIVNKHVSAMGFVKFDILSIATLKVINHALHLISERTGRPYEELKEGIRPHLLDLNDIKVLKRVFWDGNYAGVFQFTEKGIRRLAQRIRPDSFEDVSAICSLYRPGPLGSKMDRLYAENKQKFLAGDLTYEHPVLEKILAPTYGCLVYQEQLMQVCQLLGKMEFKDVQRVRKVLLKKDKSKSAEFLKKEGDELRGKFVVGCLENGLTEERAEGWWRDLLFFGGYGFNVCLTGDTVVTRSSGNQHVGITATIRELWEAQESRTSEGKLTPIAKKMRYAGIQILQMDDDGRIRPGTMKRIIRNGSAPVFEITTISSRQIRATAPHRFLTPDGYKTVFEFDDATQIVMMGESEPYIPKGPSHRGRGKSYVRQGWPVGDDNPSWIDGRTNCLVEAKRQVRSRAGGHCEICRAEQTTIHSLEFAHTSPLESLEGDYSKYHSSSNIRHLCNSCHKKFDYENGERKRRWSRGRPTVIECVRSIQPSGEVDVFDVEMDTVGHNFIANGFVSHNSHSKAYSVMTTQCAHLATYHPLEFYTAVLTCAQSGDIQEYVSDIKRCGIPVLPVDVNRSRMHHTIESLPDGREGIRLSLLSVLGVGAKAVVKLVEGQPYSDLLDLLDRSGASKTTVQPLIMVGAFDELHPNIRALEQRYQHLCENPKLKAKKNRESLERAMAEFPDTIDDYPSHEKVFHEVNLMGFSVRGSPFDILDRDKKIRALFEGSTLDYKEFLESELEVGALPVVLKEVKERPQRNGQLFAFLKFGVESGEEFESPCFASIWRHIGPQMKKGSVYVATFNRKPEDPQSLIVGRPGFAHSAHSSSQYMVNVDDIEV